MSFDEFIIANRRPPTGREAARMAIKSVVSIAAMEAAGALLKPMLSGGGFWGRAEKLNVQPTDRQALLNRIRAVNNDLLSTKLDPTQLNAKSESLANRYEPLLNEQKKLIDDLKPDMAKQGDAAAVESEAANEIARIDAAIDALHQAKLVASASITPAGDPAAAAQATEFTYNDTAANRKTITDQFGASNTKIDKDGVITVNRSDGVQLTIRPAPPPSQGAPAQGGTAQGAGTHSDQSGPATTDPQQQGKPPDTSGDKGDPQKGAKAEDTPADPTQQKPPSSKVSKARRQLQPQDSHPRLRTSLLAAPRSSIAERLYFDVHIPPDCSTPFPSLVPAARAPAP